MDIQKLKTESGPLSLRDRIFSHSKYEYPVVTFFVLLLTLLAHGKSLQGSWRWDDGAHLSFAVICSPWEYFFEPNITRAHTSSNLAPWNILFYDINLSLFQMNPMGHYAHLLLIIALGSILFYAVLRQWMQPVPAIIGITILLLGKPTYHIAAGLMHGHYATGFALTMLSILGWTHYLKGGGVSWLWLSVSAYLLATTCKEVYVPLVVLLPFLPVGTLKQRIRPLLPFILIALAYTGWRYIVLGRLMGGYSQAPPIPASAIHQLSNIPHLLIGSKLPGITIEVLTIGLLGIALFNKRINWLLFLTTFAVIFLPILPLTSFPGINQADRYLFMPWLAFSALLANLISNLKTPAAIALTGALLIPTLFSTHIQVRHELKDDLAFWDTVYPFALSAKKDQQALFIGQDDGYKKLVLTSARNANDHFSEDPTPGRLQIVDAHGNGLLRVKLAEMQLFEYKDKKIIPISKETIIEKFPQYPSLQAPKNIPLEISLSLQLEKLYWKFGPYDGEYRIKIRSLPNFPVAGIQLPREGSTPWTEGRHLKLSFCHENIKTEIIACSSELEFSLKENEASTWKGFGEYSTIQ